MQQFINSYDGAFPLFSIVIPKKQTCFHRTSCAVWPWDLQHNHDSILLVQEVLHCYQQQRCSSASLCTRGRVPSVDESCNVPERRDGGAGTPNWPRQPGKEPVSFVSTSWNPFSWPQVGTGLPLQVQQHLLSDSALQMRPLGKWRFFLTFMENMWDSTKLIPLIQFDMLNVWPNLQGRNVWEEAALPLLVALRQQVGWPGGKPPWRSTCKD